MAHSIKVIVLGFGLLALCLLIGGWLGAPTASSGLAAAARVFIPLWFLGAGINMWFGFKKGYSVAEEIPFFLLVFGVPAAVAVILAWRLAHR